MSQKIIVLLVSLLMISMTLWAQQPGDSVVSLPAAVTEQTVDNNEAVLADPPPPAVAETDAPAQETGSDPAPADAVVETPPVAIEPPPPAPPAPPAPAAEVITITPSVKEEPAKKDGDRKDRKKKEKLVKLEDSKTRIGVLTPLLSDEKNESFRGEVESGIKQHLLSMGGYEIMTQQMMKEEFVKIKERLPSPCQDPYCAASVGEALQLDRMLFGSVDKGDKTYAVRLTLVDVYSKKVIEKCSIEGEAGAALDLVIKLAIGKLHGFSDKRLDTMVHNYFGPKVHNEKQMLIMSGISLAGGALWSIINSATTKGKSVAADYLNWEKMTLGINTSAELIPLFARPAAMGNCYVAASDDAYGVFFNPAGLAWAEGREVGFGYQSRFGLNNFAGSYVNKATREIGFGQGFLFSGDRQGLFSETFVYTSFSYKFNQIVNFLRPFSLGATVKISTKRTGGSDISPSSISGSATGIGLNLGLQMEFSEKIRYGLLVRNLPSYIFWNNKSTGRKYSESEAIEMQMGGVFQATYNTMLICEGRIPLYDEQPWRFAGGAEWTFFKVAKLRLGAEKSEGLKTPWKVNGGLGLKIKKVNVDGSYEFNTLRVFANVLNFSFRVGF